MRNGTTLLDGYVPDEDATVVERVLDAGGVILGKAVCESLCFSGGSHTADSGPVRNPYDPTRSTGGSSTGSAALVAAGEVDPAIGGDQGGSVRIPSCWSGIYGLKPTWGLVPYTGAFPIEMSLDHLGPMAATTRDVALLLSVLAGPDGLDPRQHAGLHPADYLGALTGDVAGLRLALVREGFGIAGLSEADVDEAVREAAHAFERLGAKVEEVSIPWHRDAMAVWNAIAVEGATAIMVAGESMARGAKSHYATGLVDALRRGPPGQGRPAVGDGEGDGAGRAVDGRDPPRPLLRQGPEPGPHRHRGLRRGPGRPRPARHADPSPQGDRAPRARLPGRGLCGQDRHADEATILRAADAFERQVFRPDPPARPAPPAPPGFTGETG
jgi:Asp-tRNA(Asn)/Glu-tRNA(Gln) amidotransferase A subunit family amidase